jgi:hypothetical protein
MSGNNTLSPRAKRLMIAAIAIEVAFLLALVLSAPAWAGSADLHEKFQRGVDGSGRRCAWATARYYRSGSITGRTLWWVKEHVHWCRSLDRKRIVNTRFSWDYGSGAAWDFKAWVFKHRAHVTVKPHHDSAVRKALFQGGTAVPWLHDNDYPTLGLTVYLPGVHHKMSDAAVAVYTHCDGC